MLISNKVLVDITSEECRRELADLLSQVLTNEQNEPINRVPNSEMKFFSREFSAKFQGFSRVLLTMFSKNIIITYRSACTHPPFILRFT